MLLLEWLRRWVRHPGRCTHQQRRSEGAVSEQQHRRPMPEVLLQRGDVLRGHMCGTDQMRPQKMISRIVVLDYIGHLVGWEPPGGSAPACFFHWK